MNGEYKVDPVEDLRLFAQTVMRCCIVVRKIFQSQNYAKYSRNKKALSPHPTTEIFSPSAFNIASSVSSVGLPPSPSAL